MRVVEEFLSDSYQDLSETYTGHRYIYVFYLGLSGTYKEHYEIPIRVLFGPSRKLFSVSI